MTRPAGSELGTVTPVPGATPVDPLHVVRWFAHHFDRPFSEAAVLSRLPADADPAGAALLDRALGAIGLKSRLYKKTLRSLDPIVLPCVLFDTGGQPLVLTAIDRANGTADWIDTARQNASYSGPLRQLQRRVRPNLMLVTVEDQTKPSRQTPKVQTGNWFWAPVRANWSAWMQVLLASLLLNIMGLALPLFIMNVYDKVVPNLSFVTLWTLAIGVGLAILFDLVLRTVRAATLHTISRRVDLRVGSALYRHALDLGLLDREGGAAGLAGRIREYETVRDFFTSSTFVSFFDLIFIGVFLGVLYAIVGQLALVPLLAVPVVLTLALIARAAIANVADTAVELATRRQIVLMESLHGIETVKTLNAEPAMQREWENTIAATARTTGRAQFWSNLSINGTLWIQQMVGVVIIVWGVFLIFEREITIGALIAASILSGRAMAPLSSIAQATFRAQYVIRSMRALNDIMAKPTERAAQVRSNLAIREGHLQIESLSFTYPGANTPAIDELSLKVQAGEIIALLGRVGSGKTTLGRLLAGLLEPQSGTIQIDGFGLNQYDRAELRAGLGYLPQRPDLFTGTLRENLVMGQPNASQEQIERALYFSGLADFVASSADGLDMKISENGSRLSGGQAQALSLARLLLKRPPILFLDEPTNAMDQEMERQVCERLTELNEAGTTLILCTHRQSVAAIAKRYVILDGGRKALDGGRELVQQQLATSTPARVGKV